MIFQLIPEEIIGASSKLIEQYKELEKDLYDSSDKGKQNKKEHPERFIDFFDRCERTEKRLLNIVNQEIN